MSEGSSVDPRVSSRFDERYDPRRWLYVGLAALSVLIGVAVVLDVAVSLWRNQLPSWSLGAAPWSWIFGLVGFLIAIWIVVWVLGLLFWGLSGGPYFGHYWRHY